MGHAHIERCTLSFPGPNSKGTLCAAGIPEVADAGGARFPTNAPSLGSGSSTVGAYVNLAADCYHRIPLHAKDSPVRAISIAPDSAIHTCDVALAGKDGELERHRISPGNPLVGCRSDADWAFVSIPNSIPVLLDAATIVAADGIKTALDSRLGAASIGWPLRLELWRGECVELRSPQRAAYFSHSIYSLTDDGAAEGATTADFFICVDGRKRIDVTVWLTDPINDESVTITAFACEAFKQASPSQGLDLRVEIPLVLDAAGNTSVIVAKNVPTTFSLDGNPITLLKIHLALVLSGGADAATPQLHVKAYDS